MGFAAVALLILFGSYADQLYTQGEYQLAALEYGRILFEAGDTLGHAEEALKLARCRQILGDVQGALLLYGYLAEGLPDGDARAEALLGAGSVYSDLGDYGYASQAYERASETTLDSDLVYRAQVLSALTPLHSFQWSESESQLARLSRSWTGERGLFAEDLTRLAHSGEDLSHRSPFLCGLSSAVLPGSGQMLCGHTKDGIISLAMTAATGALFYLSLEEENTSTSVLLGWISLSFYGANIYGGSRAAEYYNSQRRRELLQEVYDKVEEWEQR
jgi:tetratricopeptide (TPR) repeat protein